jgi:hypothetical protein
MRHRIRQSLRPRLDTLSAEVQSLEPRTLPAGTVTASVTGGSITLNGDRLDNSIEVELTPEGIFVRGVDGTNIKMGVRTISDGSDVKLAPGPSVTRDLVINLKDGDDSVSVYAGRDSVNAVIGRNLKINTGRGSDVAQIEVRDGTLTIGNELNIELDADADRLLLDGNARVETDLPEQLEEMKTAPLHVTGLAKISGGSGDDVIGVVNVSTGGNVEIQTGHGDDTIGIEDALVGANAVISTGAGNDDVGIAYVTVLGRTNITTGSGDDRVGIFSGHAEGDVTILLQQGNDTLAVDGELSVGEDAQVTLNGGNGRNETDTLGADVESDLALIATIISFEAFDSPTLASDILDDVFGTIFGVP